MSLEAQIEELRAELAANICVREARKIARELSAALAEKQRRIETRAPSER